MKSANTTDPGDRIAVLDALELIAALTREGLPLISWTIAPHPGRVDITGHAGQVRGGDSPAEVRDTVRSYAQHLGVEADERTGKRQDSIHARTEIRGCRVDVWGVTAIRDHEEGAQ